MITIDGALGEGGGQMLRTALALSAITQQPFSMHRIRARRAKPGLQAQHLSAVHAAAAICSARAEGAALGAGELTFSPNPISHGAYRFAIGTAGAVPLLLQTIFFPLSLAGGGSTVTLVGGTHVNWSPIFPYLDGVWLPFMQRLGYSASLSLERAGFYPQGGGQMQARIHPAGPLEGLQAVQRGELVRIRGHAAVGNLPLEIAKRMKLHALRRLEPLCRETKIRDGETPAQGKGAFVMLLAEYEHTLAGFSALGAPGKRGEIVADEAAAALESFHACGAAIDAHLADQLLLPLALARKPSALRVEQITQHLISNAGVIRQFLAVDIQIEGDEGATGEVRIAGLP